MSQSIPLPVLLTVFFVAVIWAWYRKGGPFSRFCIAVVFAGTASACTSQPMPTQPSGTAAVPPAPVAPSVDGVATRTFVNRDSGDAVEGWNTFITDPMGSSTLGYGSHTIAISSAGGDGWVEIGFVTLTPGA